MEVYDNLTNVNRSLKVDMRFKCDPKNHWDTPDEGKCQQLYMYIKVKLSTLY